MKTIALTSGSFFIAAILGCASKESLVESTKAGAYIKEGVVYSLPKQLVKISFSRTLIDSKAAEKKLKQAKDDVDKTRDAIKEADGKEKEILALISKLDPLAPERDSVAAKLNKRLTLTKTKKAALEDKLLTQSSAFSDAAYEHSASLNDPLAYSEKLELTPQPTITDNKNSFYAIVDHSSASSDTVEIKTKNGLLDGAIGQSEDKTGEIITALASTLATTSRPFSEKIVNRSSGAPHKAPLKLPCDKSLAASITQTIDPSDPIEINAVNRLLKKTACLEMEITHETILNDIGSRRDFEGLVYRQPGIVDFNIYNLEDKSKQLLQTISLPLAQGGQIGYISLPKGRFAKNEYDIAFSNGALIKSKLVQPSETMGAAMIIPNAIKGVFALPTELIKLKVDYSSQEKSMAEIKKAIIDAQVEIEKQKIEIEQLKD